MIFFDTGCPEDRYGVQCLNLCACENQAVCSPANGQCTCTPGWTGKLCENRKFFEDVFLQRVEVNFMDLFCFGVFNLFITLCVGITTATISDGVW